MVTVRLPCGAVAARAKDKLSCAAVAFATVTLEMPVVGLMLTCPLPTPERLKHPVDVTVILGEVPAVTWVGEIPMSGAFGTAVTWNVAEAVRIVSVRGPPRAQLARANDKVRPDAVTPLTLILETPSLGLIVTCPAVTPDRSNPLVDAMVKVAEVPAAIEAGDMVMPGPGGTPVGVKLLKLPWSTEPMTRNDVGRPVISSFQVSVVAAGTSV